MTLHQIGHFFGALLACAPLCGNAGDQAIQVYSSGSTGVDGPFSPQIVDRIDGPELQGVPPGTRLFRGRQAGQPRNWIFLPLPPDGVFQFTRFELPAGFEMAFDTRGTTNPGVTILAQEDIVLGGWISVAPVETLMANNPELLTATENPNHGNFTSTIPGPGGFPGGAGFRQMGTGPLPGVGRGQVAGTTDGSGVVREVPLTLPLIGGSGAATTMERPDSFPYVGSGGGGTLVLASSGIVRFAGGGVHLMATSHFRYQNNSLEHRVEGYFSGGNHGSVAVFANEVKGDLKLDQSGDLHKRVLMAAFDQEFYNPTRVNITPPWPVGVTGLDMPVNPSVSFVEFNDQNITNHVGSRVVVSSNGNYPLTIETRNLPPGVVFRTTIHRLAPNGDRTGVTHVDFPATVSVAPGVCRARASIPVETGSQFVTAIATSRLQTVQCPTIQGELLETMVVEVDDRGRQRVHFRTPTGREVSYPEAIHAARQQGKLGFLSVI